jgi:hypothetical protein
MPDYAKDRDAAWGFGNTILYRMCKEEPCHRDLDVVSAKLWLIGRSYAASPERGSGVAPEGETPAFFDWLAERMNWPALDRTLDKLSEDNPFGPDTLCLILDLHRCFHERLRSAIKLRLNGLEARRQTSFCSKYLHFHKPDHFPLFDSYVSAAVSRATGPWKRYECGPKHDPKYSRFCQQLLIYRQDKANLTLRGLDRDLYDQERAFRAAKASEASV